MANSGGEGDFNNILFEKKLTNLKDSQESINTCCHWCLENRQHHKKIVNAWLNVLKRVKVEHRLTLFYLANDVIQYSKRRNYEFVESWGTTLQKATTMVRDEKVKHKILRIFKIWEQRGVYGEEFITDLSGLISASPSSRKTDEPHEFQSSYLVTKIRACAKLEADTDLKLKKFKEFKPPLLDSEALCSTLKDRAHLDDVEKEMDEYVSHIESYVNALKLEIKARNNLISLLMQAESQLDNDKKDVKLVANAYKTFASRVKAQKKKIEDIKPTLNSPIPSPDVNAPSPSPDSDIDLPNMEITTAPVTTEITQSIYTNAGFYNPVPPPATEPSSSFLNNGFASFMGTNMPFNIQNINATLFGNTTTPSTTQSNTEQTQTTNIYSSSNSISSLFPSIIQPPPPPAPVPPVTSTTEYQYTPSQIPLMPPPIPPFSKSESSFANASTYMNNYNSRSSTNYGNSSYDQSPTTYPQSNQIYPPSTTYQPPITTYSVPQSPQFSSTSTNYQSNQYDTPITSFQDTSFPPPPPPVSNFTPTDEYNPEEEPETWEPEGNWEQPPVDLETPESPPMFEKEGYCDPVEYHDTQSMGSGVDIDHRVFTLAPPKTSSDNDVIPRKKDVDHRNLISLTGSPKSNNSESVTWKSRIDQDYRTAQKSKNESDRDYRVPFNFENLKLPPPPPPPSQQNIIMPSKLKKQSPRKGDNIESIDMDMSDEDLTDSGSNTQEAVNDNLTVVQLVDDFNKNGSDLEPPPPFPEFTDDADANANNLLDDLNDDLDNAKDLISALEDEDLVDLMNPSGLFQEDSNSQGFSKQFSSNSLDESGQFTNLQNQLAFPDAHNGLPNMMMSPNMNFATPMGGSSWMESSFNPEFAFRGRGNKRGNFMNRGDFRGRPRGGPWRARGNFRGNNVTRGGNSQWGNSNMNVNNNNSMRGHVNMRGTNRGVMPPGRIMNRGRGGRPFFRGRFRGGF